MKSNRRRVADGKIAFRHMPPEQRLTFIAWISSECGGSICQTGDGRYSLYSLAIGDPDQIKGNAAHAIIFDDPMKGGA